jgi:hypothetical protein
MQRPVAAEIVVHPPALHVTKALRAQFAVLPVLEDARVTLAADGLDHVYNNLSQVLPAATKSVLDNPDDETTVSEFIASLIVAFRNTPNGLLGAAKHRAEGVTEKVVGALEIELARPNYSPLAELFSAVQTVVEKLHHRTGIVLTDAPAVTQTLEYSSIKPHSLRCPYQVGGVTPFSMTGAKASSNVILSIAARHFDWASLLAVPYVLFHEFVAHAFQGPWNGIRSASINSRFGEGWMDFVALTAHDALMDGKLAIGTAPLPGGASSHKAIALDYSQARLLPTDDGNDLPAQREVGYRSAQALYEALLGLPLTRHNPLDAFFRLSLLINTSSLRLDRRDQLATDLGALFRTGPPGTFFEVAYRRMVPSLQPLIEACLRTGDVDTLATSTRNLQLRR